jgi:hypothetical protein
MASAVAAGFNGVARVKARKEKNIRLQGTNFTIIFLAQGKQSSCCQQLFFGWRSMCFTRAQKYIGGCNFCDA